MLQSTDSIVKTLVSHPATAMHCSACVTVHYSTVQLSRSGEDPKVRHYNVSASLMVYLVLRRAQASTGPLPSLLQGLTTLLVVLACRSLALASCCTSSLQPSTSWSGEWTCEHRRGLGFGALGFGVFKVPVCWQLEPMLPLPDPGVMHVACLKHSCCASCTRMPLTSIVLHC